jgi:hypothetical protein
LELELVFPLEGEIEIEIPDDLLDGTSLEIPDDLLDGTTSASPVRASLTALESACPLKRDQAGREKYAAVVRDELDWNTDWETLYEAIAGSEVVGRAFDGLVIAGLTGEERNEVFLTLIFSPLGRWRYQRDPLRGLAYFREIGEMLEFKSARIERAFKKFDLY